MERFACGTLVASGPEALQVLTETQCRKLLVVTTPEEIRLGHAERIRRSAGQPETRVFECLTRLPSMQQAVEGSQRIQAFSPDLVVALGEEAALELGKAMVCFSKRKCRLALVPTALGSGTEVTSRVTLTHNGQSHLLQNPQLQPDLAVLVPELGEQHGREWTAESGFALLSAALESHSAIREGLLSGIHGREGFAACWAALPAAFAGRKQAWKRLQTASVLTGLAVEATGLGLCRAMENSLGMVFGLSRGKAAAILLPAVVGCNAHAAGKQYASLSRAAGIGGSGEEIGSRNLRSGLIRLRRELGLPGTLVQAGVDLRAVWSSSRRIVELTLEDPECRNNPVAVDDFLVRRILEEITGRI